jgi:hypothetical protein
VAATPARGILPSEPEAFAAFSGQGIDRTREGPLKPDAAEAVEPIPVSGDNPGPVRAVAKAPDIARARWSFFPRRSSRSFGRFSVRGFGRLIRIPRRRHPGRIAGTSCPLSPLWKFSIGAVWAGSIAPPAQDPVDLLSVVNAGSAGLRLGRPQGLEEGPRLLRQLPKPLRPPPPKPVVQMESLRRPDAGVLR